MKFVRTFEPSADRQATQTAGAGKKVSAYSQKQSQARRKEGVGVSAYSQKAEPFHQNGKPTAGRFGETSLPTGKDVILVRPAFRADRGHFGETTLTWVAQREP
jgi:hypothetical protein